MEISVSNQQGKVPITVFHVVGDIDVNSYEQLQAQARQSQAAGTRNLLLDMSQVRFVSSAGIRALNNIFVLLRADAPNETDEAIRKGLSAGTFKSPHLKLVNANQRVTEALRTAGVDMFLEFHHDLDAAIASF
jgi:anti-anti-sigma factor